MTVFVFTISPASLRVAMKRWPALRSSSVPPVASSEER